MRRAVDSRMFVDTKQIALLTFDSEEGHMLLLYGMGTPIKITAQQATILFARLMKETEAEWPLLKQADDLMDTCREELLGTENAPLREHIMNWHDDYTRFLEESAEEGRNTH